MDDRIARVCKYCQGTIADEWESFVVRPKLLDARDPSSEMVVEYAHLDCYLKGMLDLIGVPIQDKVEWWVNNP